MLTTVWNVAKRDLYDWMRIGLDSIEYDRDYFIRGSITTPVRETHISTEVSDDGLRLMVIHSANTYKNIKLRVGEVSFTRVTGRELMFYHYDGLDIGSDPVPLPVIAIARPGTVYDMSSVSVNYSPRKESYTLSPSSMIRYIVDRIWSPVRDCMASSSIFGVDVNVTIHRMMRKEVIDGIAGHRACAIALLMGAARTSWHGDIGLRVSGRDLVFESGQEEREVDVGEEQTERIMDELVERAYNSLGITEEAMPVGNRIDASRILDDRIRDFVARGCGLDGEVRMIAMRDCTLQEARIIVTPDNRVFAGNGNNKITAEITDVPVIIRNEPSNFLSRYTYTIVNSIDEIVKMAQRQMELDRGPKSMFIHENGFFSSQFNFITVSCNGALLLTDIWFSLRDVMYRGGSYLSTMRWAWRSLWGGSRSVVNASHADMYSQEYTLMVMNALQSVVCDATAEEAFMKVLRRG